MESYIPISFLNDFIFCPRSIYYHRLYSTYKKSTYQQKPQIAGTAAHESIDRKFYSKKINVLMNYEIYVEKYKLYGKIDVFDYKTGILTERKRSIKQIYDGYIFQVYAHFFGLQELGYKVKKIRIYDLKANKNYPIPLPNEASEMFQKFEALVAKINRFRLTDPSFVPNPIKCAACIYASLCDKASVC
ncbi:MAG: type V CRISPR-associated protein Cas4 [Flavobacteriaceae bacterium]|nr:type V CRISPR-associated protein Cas4 [Flavobacteriaceae bacterium]